MNTSKDELIKQVGETGDAVVAAVGAFSEDQLNVSPFEGCWTGGQVAEHLILSAGVVQVIRGKTAGTGRVADEKVQPIADIFLDFSTKLKSPDFIIPSTGPHEKTPLLNNLKNIWLQLGEAVRTLDLSETCLEFELPGMGTLTRLEWIWFYVFHSQRHLRQLKNIFVRVGD